MRLRNGQHNGLRGTFWAWPIDGYYDLHHAAYGIAPDGSDIVSEGHATLAEARAEARELTTLERWTR